MQSKNPTKSEHGPRMHFILNSQFELPFLDSISLIHLSASSCKESTNNIHKKPSEADEVYRDNFKEGLLL